MANSYVYVEYAQRTWTDFFKNAEEMITHFLKQGYPLKNLNHNMEKCIQLTRYDLLKHKPKAPKKDMENKTFVVQTFPPCDNSLTMTVKKNWEILGKSKTTKNLYRSDLICSYKRPKSIKDYLVRARTHLHPEIDTPNREKKSDINE